jgi:phosphoribosylamine--glycine ligase
MRLESDLLELCLAATEGRLSEIEAQWCDQAALGVVMAAGGYPGEYAKGHPISGLEAALDDDSNAEKSSLSTGLGTAGTGMFTGTGGSKAKVFHAGTKRDGERTLTNGGRVLCVTALGADVSAAAARAYALAERIQFEGAFYRRDIGYRALKRGTTR